MYDTKLVKMKEKSKTKTPWQKAFNPNYLGSWSLEPGEEMTAVVTKTEQIDVRNQSGTSLCNVIHFDRAPQNGIHLPMIVGNKESAREMYAISGSHYIEDWVGATVTVYVKQNVKAFGGGTTEALRIKAPAGKEKLSDQRFAKMLQSIEAGKFDKVQAAERFELTKTQAEKLAAL